MLRAFEPLHSVSPAILEFLGLLHWE